MFTTVKNTKIFWIGSLFSMALVFFIIFLIFFVNPINFTLPFEAKINNYAKENYYLEALFAMDYEQGLFEFSSDYSQVINTPVFDEERIKKSLENYFFFNILSSVTETINTLNKENPPPEKKIVKSVISTVNIRQKAFQSMVLYTKGLEQSRIGKKGLAINYFTGAINTLGRHQRAHFQRVLAYYELKNLAKGNYDANVFNRIYPSSWQSYFLKGELLYQTKKYFQANQFIKLAIVKGGSNNSYIIKRYADSFYRLKKYLRAAKEYKRAASLAKSSARYYYLAGLAYAKAKDYENASHSYLSSIQVNRKYYEANLKLAELYFRQKNYSSSKKYYVYAMTLRPKSSRAYNGYGMLNIKLKDFEQAIIYFNQALLFSKNNHYYLNNLGFALESNGQNEEALRKYNLAIKARPSYAKSYLNKAILCEKMGRFHDAETSLTSYKKLKGKKTKKPSI